MWWGPLVRLELRVASRRLRTWLGRMGAALLVLFVLWAVYRPWVDSQGEVRLEQIASLGRFFSGAITWLQLAAILVLAPAGAATAVPRAAECRRLETILCTDLSSRELVLGYLVGRVLPLAAALAAAAPVLACSVMLGGVDLRRLLQAECLLGATLVSTSAIAQAVGLGARRSRDAMVRGYLALLLLLWLPWLLAQAASRTGLPRSWSDPALEVLWAGHPFLVLRELLSSTSSRQGSPLRELLGLLALQGLASVVAVGWSAWRLRRLPQTSELPRRNWLPNWRWPRPAVGRWPILWKELWVERSRGATLVLTRLGGLAIVGGCLLASWSLHEQAFAGTLLWHDLATNHLAISILIAWFSLAAVVLRASGSVSTERDRDCWTVLLGTPLSAREIVAGKVLGGLAPLVWILPVWLLLYGIAALHEPRLWPQLPITLSVWWLLGICASAWGVQLSLHLSTAARAALAALALWILASGGYLICCGPLLVVATLGSWLPYELTVMPMLPLLLAYPSLVALSADLVADLSLLAVEGSTRLGPVVAFGVALAGYLGLGLGVWASTTSSFADACDRFENQPARRSRPDPTDRG